MSSSTSAWVSANVKNYNNASAYTFERLFLYFTSKSNSERRKRQCINRPDVSDIAISHRRQDWSALTVKCTTWR